MILPLMILTFSGNIQGQVQDITEDGKSVKIPFQKYNDFIIVEAVLFGNLRLNLIFDTGAEHTLLFNRIYTDLMGVEYDRRIPVYGADLSRELHALIARNVRIRVGPSKTKQLSILVLEDDYSVIDQLIGVPVHGLLGSSFFGDHVVEINYRRKYIELHRVFEFEHPGENFRTFEIEVLNGKPYVRGTILTAEGVRRELDLLLDTGADLPLLLHANMDTVLNIPETAISGKLGAGLGGYLEGFLGRSPGFELWGHSFDNIVTSYQDLDSLMRDFRDLNRQGIVGNQMLSRFHFFINYPGRTVYIRPERGVDVPFEYDKSGLFLIAAGPALNRYYISHIVKGSPADEAGLKRGDRIVAFQRWPVDFHNLRTMNRRLMSREGKNIRIRVEREDERKTFSFRLRELF